MQCYRPIFRKNMTNNILDKVNFLMEAAINKSDDKKTLSVICNLVGEHSEHEKLGRVFGYSVSDYAIAALKWIGTDESEILFEKNYSQLSAHRRQEIDKLIEKKLYLEF